MLAATMPIASMPAIKANMRLFVFCSDISDFFTVR
jgi:hypothetical protein